MGNCIFTFPDGRFEEYNENRNTEEDNNSYMWYCEYFNTILLYVKGGGRNRIKINASVLQAVGQVIECINDIVDAIENKDSFLEEEASEEPGKFITLIDKVRRHYFSTNYFSYVKDLH